jgi:hypothetical protein
MVRLLGFVAVITVGAAFALPHPACARDRVILESVLGDRAVVIITGQTQRPGVTGDEIHYWDVIQTSRKAAAKVRYPDGSTLLIGRDTKVEILPRQAGTQYNQLDWGQVRAQVEKPKTAPDPQAKPRFIIRTKTAVMGVRGTDFVAGFDPASGQSALHTLEGTVDIATDESKVMSWQGLPVEAGHAANLGNGLTAPSVETFSPAAFEQEIKAAQPEILTMADPRDGERKPDSPEPPANAVQPQSQTQVTPRARHESKSSSLLGFRAGAMVIRQGSGGEYTTPQISWTPVLDLLGLLNVRLDLSAFWLKRGTDGSTFPGFAGAALADIGWFAPLHIDAGAGYESWGNNSDSAKGPFFRGDLSWEIEGNHLLDHIYAGASYFTGFHDSQNNALQFHGGIGVRF